MSATFVFYFNCEKSFKFSNVLFIVILAKLIKSSKTTIKLLENLHAKLAIIGAGISGLSLANLLKDKFQITIFEKARGVSGRMSTRRAEPYFFDHGAQYFTARTDEFQKFLKPMLDNGLVKRWDARYVKFDHDQIIERKNWQDDEPRYVGVPV